MKESISNAFLVNLVIIFIIIFIFFFTGSLSYSKAFKVKNRIIDIIEKYEGYNKKDVEAEIISTLGEMGYRISNDKSCPKRNGKDAINSISGSYHYCVYEYTASKGNYYGVTAYMYFDFPIIGQSVKFPVYGETRVFGILK